MSERAARRRLVRLLFAPIVAVHLAVYGGYVLLTRQQEQRQLFLGARDAWKAGDLATAAADYHGFIADYAAVTTPFVIVRGMPSAASAWFALGRVESERGAVDAALAAFQQSMALENGLGRREYRDLLFESGRYAALESYARATLARYPDSLPATYDLGAALYASGRAAEAAAVYRRGIALLPAFLAIEDPHYHGLLPAREAELLNLESVALLAAGDAAGATAVCAGLSARLRPGVHLDQLCRAYLADAGGDPAAARAALAGYQPRTPEQALLSTTLEARLAPRGH